jgi:hypothetical protein
MPQTDFNGDGRDDILWRERDLGLIGNWLSDGEGRFVDNSANSLVSVPNNLWWVVATGDFNGDGYDDIAWSGIGWLLGNWLGGIGGHFTIHPTVVQIPNLYPVGSGDFDGDGNDELLVMGLSNVENRTLRLLLTGPDGQPELSSGIVGTVPPEWSVVQMGDFNGDGRTDILWRHENGTFGNWLANESGTGFTINNASLVHVSGWTTAGVGDFNGDGFDDLMWRTDGLIGYWLGGSGGLFTIREDSIVQVSADWELVATGDFDGDGIDDLLWREFQTGAFTTWQGSESGVFDTNLAPMQQVSPYWIVQPDTVYWAERSYWLG